MKIQTGETTAHLTYSTNVHPTESITDLNALLGETCAPLKARLQPDGSFGLGLYLPASVVGEFKKNEYRRWEMDALLEKEGFYLFTLNCFPFGNFHAERVKEKVFEPDWTTTERFEYTRDAADLLARWLPEGVRGSISTHTGAYGKKAPGDPALEAVAEKMARLALHLKRIEDKTGKHIVLALEPEPFAVVEQSLEFTHFFEDVLLRFGGDYLQKRWGESEDVLRRYLGVCFDTCHLSVQYEKLSHSLSLYKDKGISIAKAQLSVAVSLPHPAKNPEGTKRFHSFVEPRYFHQAVLSYGGSGTQAFPDLSEALAAEGMGICHELRSHFHVPIFWEGDEQVRTTRKDLEAVLPELAQETDHLEIETYTWDVIPERERTAMAPDLVTSLENEYRWVLGQIS